MAVPIIQICGDPTVDWMAIRQQREPGIGPHFWKPEQTPHVRLSAQSGGAALLTEFTKALLPGRAAVEGVTLDDAVLRDPMAAITRSWTLWEHGNKEHPGFRIAEYTTHEPGAWSRALPVPQGKPDLLIIEDSGLGFRGAEERKAEETEWPESLRVGSDHRPGHVLVKLSICSAGEKMPVLDRIRKCNLAKDTTIVVSVGDIRVCPVRASESLSWERMLEQVRAAVWSSACPFVTGGKIDYARIIVTIGASGAALISADSTALVFDRFGQEGDYERRFKGKMMGYNTCLVGVLAAEWIQGGKGTDWTQATRNGLAVARLLQAKGYSVTKEQTLCFPHETLAQGYRQRHDNPPPGQDEGVWDLGLFQTKSETFERFRPGEWTILEQSVLGGAERASVTEKVHKKAEGIAVDGPRAVLDNVPLESIGDWHSADRIEIEGVRSVKNAMQEYLAREDPKKKPLAIAVFGPPGAGKSFAVKEMAKKLEIEKDEQLTFNLSQFESPDELAAAFHRIQDLHLQGKRPLVFWDEFDTPCEGKPLGWLRYFLAPIQDAEFSDRGRVHPTGSGIYVFAGSTRTTFDLFAANNRENERAAKKPDFISRLRAHINVRGPNPVPNLIEDSFYVVRRAFLLNSILERDYGHLKNNGEFLFGSGVLDALLHISRYRHGARSLESIVGMSALKGRKVFEQSSFPPEPLLSMHVDAAEFISLAQNRREMVRVGITGHIWLDPEKMDSIERGIEGALDEIEKIFPNRWLTAFTSLAMGADRIVTRKILKRGGRLIAVLPMPRAEYMKDFTSPDARQEFRYWLDQTATDTIPLPAKPTRDESYEAMGAYLARHCDVMIAVYDGKEAQGRAGTAHVVKQAEELGKPLLVVHAGNHKRNPEKQTKPAGEYGEFAWVNRPTS